MNRFSTFIIAVAFLTGTSEAQADDIIADARGDFVPGTTNGDPAILPATGMGEWTYLASDTVNPTLDLTGLDLLLWGGDRFLNSTGSGSENQVRLTGTGLKADEVTVVAPRVSRPPPFTVLRWIAGPGEAGIVDIAGTIRHLFRADCTFGDGSTLDIFVDGVSMFSQFIPTNDSEGFVFNVTATIGVGSKVDFVVGPNSTDCCDLPVLKATLTFVDTDSDGDGLTDDVETNTGVFVDATNTGTDPNNPDTDGDGLEDGTEVDMAMGSGCPNPLNPDSDGDTLSDGVEVAAGTNPCNVDSDGDGIPDDIDPFPTDPEGTSGFLEDESRATADEIQLLSLGLFNGPNNNANQGRRNALANRATDAANAIAAGDIQSAIDSLMSLLAKIDGQSPPPDWMDDSPERSTLQGQLIFLITLLELL